MLPLSQRSRRVTATGARILEHQRLIQFPVHPGLLKIRWRFHHTAAAIAKGTSGKPARASRSNHMHEAARQLHESATTI